MIQTILFRKVQVDLHKKIRVESVVKEISAYKLYNLIMEEFSAKIKKYNRPVYFTYESLYEYKDTRVERIDREIYKCFKMSCIWNDLTISEGINLALKCWLDSQ